MSEASTAPETGRSPAQRNRLALALAAVSIVALGAWLADRLTHIYVTDARISATMVALSARVPGWVRQVPVEEGAEVAEGAALLQLDDEMAALIHAGLLQKVEALEAEHESLARQRSMAERQTASRHAGQAAELRAAEAKAQAYAHDLEQAEAAYHRGEQLLAKGSLSPQAFEQLESRFLQARDQHAAAEAAVGAERSALEEESAGRDRVAILQAELEALEGRLAEARLEAAQAAVRLRDHQLRAPSSGIVDEIFVDPGEYVAPGQRLAMFHDPKKLWISANIKETDVAKLALGKKAEVIVDAFPNSPLEATLSRIGSAATSQFALLPNPNPSGNFTKITQRIEVRFELPDTALALKPGMMVELKIAE